MMNIQAHKYSDIRIENNTFCIVSTTSKPRNRGAALFTLEKMERVIKENLKYSNGLDDYSNLSRDKLLIKMKEQAKEIKESYLKKTAKFNWFSFSRLNWLVKKIFRIEEKEKQVKSAFTRIENLVSPPPVFPLPPVDVIQEVVKYLELPELAILARLNKHGKTHTEIAIVKRASEFGYEGKSSSEAAVYIQELFKEVKIYCNRESSLDNYIATRDTARTSAMFNSQKTLQKLKSLTTEDFLNIFSNESSYSTLSRYPKLCRYLIKLKSEQPISKVEDEELKQKGNRALILATRKNEIDLLKIVLKLGIDPNTPSGTSSALHFAAQNGSLEIAKLLLNHKARVNEEGVGGFTPLAFACGAGYSDQAKPNRAVIELLLENGADPNIAAKNGCSPLHFAIKNALVEAVELLLKYKARVNDIGMDGMTPLCSTSKFRIISLSSISKSKDSDKYTLITELLLKNGADPNIASINGNFPLHFAAQAGLIDIIKLLLQYQARVNERGVNGKTPLYFACKATHADTHLDVIKLLVDNQADPNIQAKDGTTALDIAQKKCPKAVTSLLNAKAGS